MNENHFRSHFSAFQINTQHFFLNYLFTNWPFWTAILDKIICHRISRHFRSIRNFLCFEFCSQNGRRRPLWMTENHVRSHFSPFQINTSLLFLWNFVLKMAAGGQFGWPKITCDRISHHFRSIRNFYFFYNFVHKMAAGGQFGWPKITFDRISRHFRSIRSFNFWRILFTKCPPAAILDERKSLSIAFLTISDQYATFLGGLLFSKWPPAAILDPDFCQNRYRDPPL